jgi:acetyl esterase/lipase
MKKLVVLLFFISTISYTYAQRYLTYVYPEIDSIIGGTFGTAINHLGDTQNLLFDFYSPSSDTAQKRPLIIYLHGGGFSSGTREYPSVKLLCRKLAMKGYAVANIDYRLDPNFQLYNSNTNRRAMTDAMHDAKQAIRYFKANSDLYKLDSNRIFIGGESAGAITAVMASYVDKQVEMSIYPMANPNNPIGSNSNSEFGNEVNGTLCLCGMLLDTTAIESSNDPPILWTHGSADTYIPISLAFNIVSRALNIGLPIQTKIYEGATHCPWYYGNPNWETYLDSTLNDITNFLYPKVNTPVGIQDYAMSFNTYPNPSTGLINIDLEKHYSKIHISIISFTGHIYHAWDFQNAKTISLNLKKLGKGFFILKVQLNNNLTLAKKIIII